MPAPHSPHRQFHGRTAICRASALRLRYTLVHDGTRALEVREVFGRKKNTDVEVIRDFKREELEVDEEGKVILPDDITYAELLHLTHPELTADELRETIAKEKGQEWLVRFMVVAIIALIVLIVILHVTSS